MQPLNPTNNTTPPSINLYSISIGETTHNFLSTWPTYCSSWANSVTQQTDMWVSLSTVSTNLCPSIIPSYYRVSPSSSSSLTIIIIIHPPSVLLHQMLGPIDHLMPHNVMQEIQKEMANYRDHLLLKVPCLPLLTAKF